MVELFGSDHEKNADCKITEDEWEKALNQGEKFRQQYEQSHKGYASLTHRNKLFRIFCDFGCLPFTTVTSSIATYHTDQLREFVELMKKNIFLYDHVLSLFLGMTPSHFRMYINNKGTVLKREIAAHRIIASLTQEWKRYCFLEKDLVHFRGYVKVKLEKSLIA